MSYGRTAKQKVVNGDKYIRLQTMMIKWLREWWIMTKYQGEQGEVNAS